MNERDKHIRAANVAMWKQSMSLCQPSEDLKSLRKMREQAGLTVSAVAEVCSGKDTVEARGIVNAAENGVVGGPLDAELRRFLGAVATFLEWQRGRLAEPTLPGGRATPVCREATRCLLSTNRSGSNRERKGRAQSAR